MFPSAVGDSTCGQRAVYQLGMTGIPIYNVSVWVKHASKVVRILSLSHTHTHTGEQCMLHGVICTAVGSAASTGRNMPVRDGPWLREDGERVSHSKSKCSGIAPLGCIA